ncbi:MAG: endonuclease/exonuclease/phosphatase family protein [bacterium]
MNLLRAVTYNVHGWRGRGGGEPDVTRAVEVVRELHADVVGMQEVSLPRKVDVPSLEAYLAAATGMQVIFGPTLVCEEASYGNLLLVRRPLLEVRRHELSQTACEPRGAIEALLEVGADEPLRVITTHLGLSARERNSQIERLMEILNSGSVGFVVLLGDFNVWLPWRTPTSAFDRWFGRSPRAPTFPAAFPIMCLDRIWVRPGWRLGALRVHRTPQARSASDHLPMEAVVRCHKESRPLPVVSGQQDRRLGLTAGGRGRE